MYRSDTNNQKTIVQCLNGLLVWLRKIEQNESKRFSYTNKNKKHFLFFFCQQNTYRHVRKRLQTHSDTSLYVFLLDCLVNTRINQRLLSFVAKLVLPLRTINASKFWTSIDRCAYKLINNTTVGCVTTCLLARLNMFEIYRQIS